MPYTIRKRDTYRWPVRHVVEIVKGREVEMAFDGVFKAIPTKRVNELLVACAKGDMEDGAFLDEVFAGWDDLELEPEPVVHASAPPPAKLPFEYDAANLQLLIETYPGITGSIAAAWTESVVGGAAALKNLLRRRPGG